MKVLVIGGTGLISTAIVNHLIEKKFETIVYNRGARAVRYDSTRVTEVHGDRHNYAAFASQMAELKPDAVIDMITFDPETALHAVEVFSGKVTHYLFTSTVCVYGGPVTRIPTLEDEPHKPTGEYGRNKSAAEKIFMHAHAKNGFPVTMFRPSHCYGEGAPRLDIWGYRGALMSRLREGKPVIVPGDGHGLWQPGHVADMAKGFVGALGRDVTKGKAYNIVGDEVMTWSEFHQRAARVLGAEANLVPMTTTEILAGAPADKNWMLDEIFQYHASYSSAALKADVPEYTDLLTFEEGVKRTVAWADANGAVEPSNAQAWVDEMVAKRMDYLGSLKQ